MPLAMSDRAPGLSWSAVPRPIAKTLLFTDAAAAAMVLSAVSLPSVNTMVAVLCVAAGDRGELRGGRLQAVADGGQPGRLVVVRR